MDENNRIVRSMRKLNICLLLFVVIILQFHCSSGVSKFRKSINDGIDYGAKSNPIWGTKIGYHKYDDILPYYSSEGLEKYRESAQNDLDKFQKYDTTGWAIDDRIDYIIEVSSRHHIIESKTYENLAYESACHCINDLCNGIGLILFRKQLDFKNKNRAFLGRVLEIPLTLENALNNISTCSKEDYYCASYRSEHILSVITGYSKVLLDSFPEMNAEISTIRDKARKAIYDFLNSIYDEKMASNSEGDPERTAEIYDDILSTEMIYDISLDSILSMAENDFQYADSLYNYYKSKLPADDDSQYGHMFFSIPNEDSALAYCYNEIDVISNFLENHNIMSVTDDFPQIEFAKIPRFARSIKIDFVITPGSFEKNQTALMYMNTRLEASGYDTASFGIQYNNDFRENLINLVIPCEYYLYFIAHKNDRPYRDIPGSYIAALGWKLYIKELMYQKGFYGDDDELIAGLFEELRGYALATIIDIKMHTGELPWEALIPYLEDKLGKEEGPKFTYFSFCTYISPAYNVSHLLGRRLILDMREKAMAVEGDNFSLRDFHDKILHEGYIPIPLIAWKYGWE